MAKSRYSSNPVMSNGVSDPIHYSTWSIPKKFWGYAPVDLLGNQEYIQYTWQFGDRLDRLAEQHLEEGQFWWVIAMVNNIRYPLNIPVGTVIKIPLSVRPILDNLGLI